MKLRAWPGLLAAILMPVSFLTASVTTNTAPSDPMAPYEHWITGTVSTEGGYLHFKMDKPARGNSTGDVVLLGTTKQASKVFLPALASAADKHLKLRLFGALLPVPDAQVKPGQPTVEFIVWKMHDPGDPDVLPPGEAIHVDEHTTVQMTNSAGMPVHYEIKETPSTNAPVTNAPAAAKP